MWFRTPDFAAIFARILGRNWADAIRNKDFGLIADWFTSCFIVIGFCGLLLLGIAAGVSGFDGLGPETIAARTTATLGAETPYSSRQLRQTNPQRAPAPKSDEVAAFSWGLGLRVLALGLILSGACTCLGWFFGLLFGIPRVGKTEQDLNGNSGESSGRVNTNFMEISDWLTKTIVGVGLTQLTVLPKFLGDLAANINRYGFQWGDYGQLAALSIVIYFLLGGFWLGYVGTRTLLTGLFESIPFSKLAISQAAAPENLQIDSDNVIRPASSALKSIDASLLAAPLQSLQSQTDVVAWAAAQARSGNLTAARDAFQNALTTDPNNQDIGRQLLKINIAMGNIHEAIALARKLPDSAPKMLAMLYDQPPIGFSTARDIGKRLLQDPNCGDSASIHVWLASAYGQEYSYEMKNGNLDKLPALEKLVEGEVTAACSIDPTTRPLLLSLWRPTAGSAEDDLKDIPQDNAVLTQLLLAPPQPAQTSS